MSPLDVSNLRAEDRGLPMHVAALAVLAGGPLLDDSGRLRLEAARGDVERRLNRAPRLRQVLCRPVLGLGAPLWVDDAGFDIAEHVLARQVPAPGDQAALLRVCAELNEPRLDRSRPLWQLWLLSGLAGGNVGMLIRLHHAVADGIAALSLMGALFDPAPAAPATATGRWRPVPKPGAWEMLAGNVRDRAAAGMTALSIVGRPALVIRRVSSLGQRALQVAREGLAPQVSLNRPVGNRRRLLLVRAHLGRARAVAHAHGATVNDVLLAAVAAAARRLLSARGELRPGLVLKVSVAASTRGPADMQGSGNLVGIMMVPLPVGEPDLFRGLEEIARATADRKRQPPYQPSAGSAQRWMVRSMFHQRLVNMFTSNIPGPPEPLFFSGARVLEVFQAGVVQGNVTVAVAVLSYAGQLNFTIVADADANPDLEVFAEGLSQALRQMGAGRASEQILG